MGLLPYFFPLFDILQRSRAEESVLLKKSLKLWYAVLHGTQLLMALSLGFAVEARG